MPEFIENNIKDPKKLALKILKQHIAEKAVEWESSVKEDIAEHATDTGVLLNSIYTEIDERGFTGGSSAKHMKYWEYGADSHFVPYYSKQGKPILAPWASRVLNMREEDMRKQGGMVVETPELAPFRRALAKL